MRQSSQRLLCERMSRRSKTPEPPSSLFEDAYRLQQGQFYPERHQANVQNLCKKYPQHSFSEIDAIYRQACLIDFEIRERVGKSQLSKGAREELLDWLENEFHGFSRDSFLRAIERAESQ